MSDKTEKLFKKALAKHKSGNYQLAEELYKKALKSDSQHIDSCYMLGTLYAEKDRLKEAKKHLLNAQKLAPNSQYVSNNLGNVYRLIGDFEQSEKCYRHSISIDPQMREACNNLAIVARRLGYIDESIKLYQQAISLDPGFKEAFFNLGKAYWDQGLDKDAHACFTRALEIDNEHTLSINALGDYYLKYKNRENAIQYFERLETLDLQDTCGGKTKLAYLKGGELPKKQSAKLVKDTYESKASDWDSDANKPDMKFLGPDIIQKEFSTLFEARVDNLYILDLGCGTGACGKFLRPHASMLEGVDLSEHMLNIAREKNIYHQLSCMDVEDYLQQNQGSYNVITASGVFIFMSELKEIIQYCFDQLKQDGYLLFTCYKSDNDEIEVRSNMHFSHSKQYIQQCAQSSGFELHKLEEIIHEYDWNVPQTGFSIVLHRK